MKIDRMEEGGLYEIKTFTILESEYHGKQASPLGPGSPNFPLLKGWRDKSQIKDRPPFLYLGWKLEDWTYACQDTSKIHYVLWQEQVWVMDNQFAKHVEPVWIKE